MRFFQEEELVPHPRVLEQLIDRCLYSPATLDSYEMTKSGAQFHAFLYIASSFLCHPREPRQTTTPTTLRRHNTQTSHTNYSTIRTHVHTLTTAF